jgi:hypothetical protein
MLNPLLYILLVPAHLEAPLRVSRELPARNKVLALAKPWPEIQARLGCRGLRGRS